MAGIQVAGEAGTPHRDRWVKLWGNVAFNPISALTGATLKASARSRTRAVAAR
jgi:ketopantoate reductase